ncbi:hypothetical protein ACQKPX_13415 [Photobacterium sp. DNB23_23_1]|uniref:Uncharacterized protein n=1 Tax=Photobacterium pectinilyticum TaxID=2906793 RepID=A0ABT1N298_9GAMM|nr:hypothetical protein [Photobacterium sp. ZSDE20]MCQ1058866.1 hypothetical protein [Photobacterium sp. ZSDE20]MDD1823844.1 hypothetical protein [Photobacterium sp. ZSDE20]
MDLRLLTLVLIFTSTSLWAGDATWGKSTQQLKRLQTVDPLAENRVPLGSPAFSGKKASKSFNSERKGSDQKKVKNKELISGVSD